MQVGGVPVGSIKNIVLTSRLQGADHDPRRLVADAAARGHHGPGAGAVADERRQPLYRADARSQQRSPRWPAGRDAADAPPPTASWTSTSCSTSSTRRRARRCRRCSRARPNSTPGTNPDFSLSVKYFSPSLASADHHLLRARSATRRRSRASSWNRPRRSRRSAPAQKRSRTWSKTPNTTFQAVGSQQANLAQGLHELPLTLRQGNRTFAELPPTLDALTAARERVQARHQKQLPLFFSRLTSLLGTATPVVGNFSQAFSQARAEQRSHRCVPRPAGARAGALDQLPERRHRAEGIGADHRPVRSLQPRSAGLRPRLRRRPAAYYDANGHYARAAPVFNDFALGANNTLTPVTPQQGLEGLKTGQLRRCPGAATQPAADGSSPFIDNGTTQLRPVGDALVNPRRRNSLAGSPLLIGAITTLIVVVAVFLSYNANNGLPFVPTYNLKIVLPETSGLQPTNQVRIAGTRVGVDQLADPPSEPGHRARHRDRRPEARKERRAAAGRYEGDRAVGVVDRAEVPGTGKGHIRADAEAGRDDPGLADARTGRHQPVVQHVRPEDEDRDPEKHDQLRRRPRRARAGAERTRSRRCARWSPTRSRRCATSPRRRPGFGELFVRARPGRLADRPGGPGQRRLLQRPRHVLQGLGGRGSLARTSDRRRPARRSSRRPTRSRTRRPSWKRAPSSCACCARPRRRCAPSPSRSATRSPKAPSTCSAATALNTDWPRPHRRSRHSPRTPSSRSVWKT